MPFGLKNVGATFTSLITKVLALWFDENIEAYVDDIVVKSHKKGTHPSDL